MPAIIPPGKKIPECCGFQIIPVQPEPREGLYIGECFLCGNRYDVTSHVLDELEMKRIGDAKS